MNRLQDRRAVITGGARGLGLACARRFAQEGARILLTDIDGEEVAKAAAILAAEGYAVEHQHCDVSSRREIAAMLARSVQLWGGADILLNNAGIAVSADILTIDEATFDRVLNINLKAAFHATQLFSRLMIEQGTGGVIINMSSVNAVLNIPHLISYNISKGGLNQLTRNSAIALARHGIRVCGIGPGTVMTDLLKNAVWTDDEARRSILSRTPMGRPAQPEEIASIAAFLASDDASYITGETIYADGGRMGLNYTVPVDA